MKLINSLIVITIIFSPIVLMARESQPLQPTTDNLRELQIERVIDDDTLIASGKTIRLWGIDAPEKDQPKFYAAQLYLKTIIQEGAFACEELYKDKYQRIVAQCFSNGKDISSLIVLIGLARDYKKYSKGHYDYEEQEAKRYKRGIWK